jgi:integrase
MARRSTGQVVERQTKRGTVFALRFYAAGDRRYETLGSDAEGWNRRKAEDELAAVMAAVRAGTWSPSQVEAEVREVPTFHEFATDWLEARKGELRPRTVADYKWALSYHLLPFFRTYLVSEIRAQDVDRYKAAKLAEGKLAPSQINKTLKRLAQIIDTAIEYELTDRANPARGRRRRVKNTPPQRTWVEPEQLPSLLEAASSPMRPVLGLLAGAGLRVGEAVALDWHDVNLATGTLRVGRAKTAAGIREVDLPGGLVDELAEWRMRGAPQFETWDGEGEPVLLSSHAGHLRRQSEANVARRLKTAIKHANGKLDELGIERISERVTPHSLRRTFASLRAASGDDPVYIADQLGHTDPRFTLSVYTKAVKRRAKLSPAYLAEYEKALAWAALSSGQQALTGTRTDALRHPSGTHLSHSA